MAIPVFVRDRKDWTPPEGVDTYYVLASNGLFLCRSGEYFQSSVPAVNMPKALKEQEMSLVVKKSCPKLAVSDLQKIAGFFRAVYKKHRSEAIVILAQNLKTKKLEIICPKQYVSSVSGMHVEYDMPNLDPAVHRYIGDIHSHCDMSAYASSTDTHDEENRDGVHIVLGKINSDKPEIYIDYAVDGSRFGGAYNLTVDGKFEKVDMDFPKEWMETINLKKHTARTGGLSYEYDDYYYKKKGSTSSKEKSRSKATFSSWSDEEMVELDEEDATALSFWSRQMEADEAEEDREKWLKDDK